MYPQGQGNLVCLIMIQMNEKVFAEMPRNKAFGSM